jgi:hypothetical protein
MNVVVILNVTYRMQGCWTSHNGNNYIPLRSS